MSDENGDPFVEELLPGYLARRREELPRLKSAVDDRDYHTLRIIGHNLHGSGAAYGLPRISEFGRDLESAAHGQDDAGARAVIDAMGAFLDTL